MACRSRGLVVFKALLKFMHNWMDTLSGRWGVYLEKPVVTQELAESRHSGSIPSFGFFLLLTCAAILTVLCSPTMKLAGRRQPRWPVR